MKHSVGRLICPPDDRSAAISTASSSVSATGSGAGSNMRTAYSGIAHKTRTYKSSAPRSSDALVRPDRRHPRQAPQARPTSEKHHRDAGPWIRCRHTPSAHPRRRSLLADTGPFSMTGQWTDVLGLAGALDSRVTPKLSSTPIPEPPAMMLTGTTRPGWASSFAADPASNRRTAPVRSPSRPPSPCQVFRPAPRQPATRVRPRGPAIGSGPVFVDSSVRG